MARDSVMERAAERKASTERVMPKVSGMGGGQLTGEVSTGHWRTSRREGYKPHEATAARRFGVKPCGGAVADIYTGPSLAGQDDGTDYFAEWREQGGICQLPTPKTRLQDSLFRLCVAYIAGEELSDETLERMREFIAKIQATDPKHGQAWRLAMGIAGLYN